MSTCVRWVLYRGSLYGWVMSGLVMLGNPHSGIVTARFVTRFNLWLRHDLWPHNASICDPARFVTKSASICDQRYTMILESKLCRGKLVFVFAFIMYTKWYNMIIYIYIWIMIRCLCKKWSAKFDVVYIDTILISCMTYIHHVSYMSIIFYASSII